MTVNRSDNNLARFRYSHPVWWNGFLAGGMAERLRSLNEEALRDDWKRADWQRLALEKVTQ